MIPVSVVLDDPETEESLVLGPFSQGVVLEANAPVNVSDVASGNLIAIRVCSEWALATRYLSRGHEYTRPWPRLFVQVVES